MASLTTLPKGDLQQRARDLQLSTEGTRPELIDRIEREQERRAFAARAPRIDITADDDEPGPVRPTPEHLLRPADAAPNALHDPERPVKGDAPDTSGRVERAATGEYTVTYQVAAGDLDRGMVSDVARQRMYTEMADAATRAGTPVRAVRLAHVFRDANGVPVRVQLTASRARG